MEPAEHFYYREGCLKSVPIKKLKKDHTMYFRSVDGELITTMVTKKYIYQSTGKNFSQVVKKGYYWDTLRKHVFGSVYRHKRIAYYWLKCIRQRNQTIDEMRAHFEEQQRIHETEEKDLHEEMRELRELLKVEQAHNRELEKMCDMHEQERLKEREAMLENEQEELAYKAKVKERLEKLEEEIFGYQAEIAFLRADLERARTIVLD